MHANEKNQNHGVHSSEFWNELRGEIERALVPLGCLADLFSEADKTQEWTLTESLYEAAHARCMQVLDTARAEAIQGGR